MAPSSKANVRPAVFAQAVVDAGDPRQRKTSELDALAVRRKQNDAREHVANFADHLGQSCVLYVCHGPPKYLVLHCRKIAALDESDEFIPFGMIQPDGIFVCPNRDDSVIRRCRLKSGLPETEASSPALYECCQMRRQGRRLRRGRAGIFPSSRHHTWMVRFHFCGEDTSWQ